MPDAALLEAAAGLVGAATLAGKLILALAVACRLHALVFAGREARAATTGESDDTPAFETSA